MSTIVHETAPANGATVANPFGAAPVVAAPTHASMAAKVQREVAEVQAQMVIAKNYPRDPKAAVDRILMDCTRVELAEDAVYQYQRGGQDISGPSIRLAEVLARGWGNISAGVTELSRANGYSECLAYAWDLETNYRDEKRFQIRHWRDTKKGGYAVTDERDIYEMIANSGARRKRACILAIIPGDVTDAALEQCEVTLKTKIDVTPELIEKLVGAFSEHNVTKAQLEARIQRRIESITPALVVQLRRIFNSLRDGMSQVADWFDPEVPPTTGGGAPAPPAAAAGPTTKTENVRERLRAQGAASAPAAGGAGETPEDASSPARGEQIAGEEAATPASGGATAVSEPDEPLFPESNEDARIVAFRSLSTDDQAMRIRVLAEGRKMLNTEGKVDINKRAAEKWGLPVGAWQIGQLVSTGYAEKMFSMLIA